MDVLLLILGICIGIILNKIHMHFAKCIGTLEIDKTHFDKDVYRIANLDLEKVPKKRFVILRINSNANLSQE